MGAIRTTGTIYLEEMLNGSYGTVPKIAPPSVPIESNADVLIVAIDSQQSIAQAGATWSKYPISTMCERGFRLQQHAFMT